MFYTNKMTIRMANTNEAKKAMEITRTTIEANKKEYNKAYSFDTASEFVNAIQLQDNSLIIPDKQLGYFTPEDCAAFTDIINAIANQLKNSFEATIICSSDYSELWIDATCDGKELKITETYFPIGDTINTFCPECDAETEIYEAVEVAPNRFEIHIFDEFASGTYTCPNCGEVVDISEELPVVTKTINFI